MDADLSNVRERDNSYLTLIIYIQITTWEIINIVNGFKSNKAPRSDEIPNELLKTILPTVMPILLWIFNASLNIGYYPAHFRDSITVALRKPQADKYDIPKAYQLVALLNTTKKVMESIIATRIGYLVESQNILPSNHIGGRKGLTCEIALHNIIKNVHQAWAEGKCATLLSLDVSGAFDNVSHERLLHNFRKRRLGGKWAN